MERKTDHNSNDKSGEDVVFKIEIVEISVDTEKPLMRMLSVLRVCMATDKLNRCRSPIMQCMSSLHQYYITLFIVLPNSLYLIGHQTINSKAVHRY